MTGLLNRAATVEGLEHALHENEQMAVAFVDVDRMKAQNDLLGHAGGDALLVDAARRLSEAVRPGDIVGRLGGDEFVAVCRNVTTPAEAMALAERLARSMHWDFSAGTLIFPVSASVGVVHCVDAASTAEVLARADVAMYRAKGSGGWAVRDVERVTFAGGRALEPRFGTSSRSAEGPMRKVSGGRGCFLG